MRSLAEIELAISVAASDQDAKAGAKALLNLGEDVLEHWVTAKGSEPTEEQREGFRLLALHRQGAKGDPSFNACRETCRELAYHYNLIDQETDTAARQKYLMLMGLVASHLFLFVSGKLETAGLGEFCCSSKPLHAAE
jgi:hypothetical protein